MPNFEKRKLEGIPSLILVIIIDSHAILSYLMLALSAEIAKPCAASVVGYALVIICLLY